MQKEYYSIWRKIITITTENIITERLCLKPLSAKDGSLIVTWRNKNKIRKFSLSHEKLTLKAHLAWFENTKKTRFDYLYYDTKDMKPIGLVSLEMNKYDRTETRSFELSKYIGDESYLGKGYALEASEALINWVFEKRIADCIFAITKIDNHRNIKVNRKLGFKIEDFPHTINLNTSSWLYMRKEYYENNG